MSEVTTHPRNIGHGKFAKVHPRVGENQESSCEGPGKTHTLIKGEGWPSDSKMTTLARTLT